MQTQELTKSHFSTCLADTLASELGILSSSRPFHILTVRRVPKGTNGGISLLGLGVSAMGGLIMGVVGVVDLIIENPACKGDVWWGVEMIGFSVVAGLAGSLVCPLSPSRITVKLTYSSTPYSAQQCNKPYTR
jgi:uncharacterized membrane protein